MPLEVRQIGIRMSVGDALPDVGPAAPPQPEGGGLDGAERSALIDECVAAVLDALRLRSER